ncbi:hypothetical protein Nepgr_011885 [Nepenthes gracilis]|uniref:WRKY domain-containing protein n=1 Tax=Nepenthes gracilis TaxID=150966 RepID=A0AAD3SFY8_NEPGR|nr:hypothetical protein Nepgr_011885 [Nepenthes gracilis]
MESPTRGITPGILLEKIVAELMKGRDSASELRRFLNSGKSLTDEVELHDLAKKTEASFSDCLSLLSTITAAEAEYLLSSENSAALTNCKSEDPGWISKDRTAKERRGCYKRRKTSQSWWVDSPNQMADPHAWRKYGQKSIQNAKHPRNYYRCTHKFDKGCQASKQVQQIGDDPPIFRTTYNCHHTCKALLKHPQIIVDSDDRSGSSVFLSFEPCSPMKQALDDSFFFSMIKQEDGFTKEELPIMTQNQSASSDYLSPLDPTVMDSPAQVAGLSSTPGSDVISGAFSSTASPHSLNIGGHLMVDSHGFDNIEEMLQFESQWGFPPFEM